MKGNHTVLIRTAATIVGTLIAAVLFYFTFMDRRDADVRAGTSIEARVTALEERSISMEKDVREIRLTVGDLYTVLVMGQPAPVRARSDGGTE